jgi:hypothetical protein
MLCSEAKIRIRGGGHCTLSLPTPTQIRVAHEAFWNWIFRENDDANHPLNVSGHRPAPQERLDNILILAGSLPDNVSKERSLQIPEGDIEYIFVPADNCVETAADAETNGTPSNLDLINTITNDIRGAEGIADVLVDGRSKGVTLLEPHLFSLSIQKVIKGTGRNGKGEGTQRGRQPPILTMAVAACYYAILSRNEWGKEIKIKGRNIEVTYTL